MKQKAAEKHDQLQVSRWHYREKLMAMKRGGNGVFEAVLLRLYWATSGFGERAVRAGVWLVVLLGVSFLANAWTPSWSWNEVIPLSAAANATMASIPFAKDIPGDGWVKAARGFWQFLIAVQLARQPLLGGGESLADRTPDKLPIKHTCTNVHKS
ncbi:MAG: hypothetical protein CVU73_15725 [Deltaproteobacteria bacterium HGW-Deltaproteobacteria-8]|nr:MAG: hypothetical protein CVU73_15725 [Deltaproteobacteria bacterium HGW-Deltaproteobacteria-8]